MEVLKDLEDQLMQNMTVARNGIAKIAEEREVTTSRIQAAYTRAEFEAPLGLRDYVEAAVESEPLPRQDDLEEA